MSTIDEEYESNIDMDVSAENEDEGGPVHKVQTTPKSSDSKSTRSVYKTYQENTKKCGILREEITKGIRDKEDTKELLLKAIECISMMTGDKAYYDINKNKLMHQ